MTLMQVDSVEMCWDLMFSTGYCMFYLCDLNLHSITNTF